MSVQKSKSTLAKLLAQENISVEHRKIPTAFFDPQNRILSLPIWKDMSNNLYDLLVGHEVGHAWDTPPEGWHKEVTGHPRGFKSYLNVIEDARIEKKIKGRYPGLRSSFYAGYKELVDKDFFGLSQYDIKELPLIDRINLHFKVGPFMAIEFNELEQDYVDRIERMDSWDDVVSIAKELYALRKTELESKIAGLDELNISEYSDGDDGDDILDELKALSDELEDPDSITDSEFRRRESELLSDVVKQYRYAYLPDVVLDKCIIPYKDIYTMTDWTRFENMKDEETAIYDEYKFQNSRFIQYLVKEFELRRNATQMARASIAKTGELDIDKVFSYKLKDDLFKRVTQIPGGKNHGMVMYVDWSGSMADVLKSTIDQTLVLADFCRKVNIPFRVFAFTDQPETIVYRKDYNHYGSGRTEKFSKNEGDLAYQYSSFSALEILSSQMNLSQYTFAQRKLLMIGDMYSRKNSWRAHHVPSALQLNGTPLDECIVFATKYNQVFKESQKLDVVNAIFLTDGESNQTEYVYNSGVTTFINRKYSIHNPRDCNTVITYKKTGAQGMAKPGQPITVALLDLMKNMSDINVIGFYIVNGNRRAVKDHLYRLNIREDTEKYQDHMREYKFIQLEDQGYSKYFIVKSADIEITEDTIDIDSEDVKSSSKLAKAFTAMQKKKLVNRVLLNRFVAEIS